MNLQSREPVIGLPSWISIDHERPASLEIILLKRTIVLPWSQFLYAEGSNEQIRLAFSTHDVLLTGRRLDSLVTHLSSQKVSRIQEQVRAEMFGSESGPQISSVCVTKVE
jgi:hypothetical protein